jgi:hypothetical protein
MSHSSEEVRLRVLVACEFSGTVRDAFIRAGHDATSCDMLPSDSDFGPHHQGDVFDIIDRGWDLMVAHPPCTFLTNSGVRWLYSEELRWQKMVEGAVFFRSLLNAPIPRIAVENPVMHGFAASIVGRKADQVVQPWMFGQMESKGIGLWLKGLPLLTPTSNVREQMLKLPKQQYARVHHAAPGKDRWKKRSVFFRSVADAMAAQWGGVAVEAVA